MKNRVILIGLAVVLALGMGLISCGSSSTLTILSISEGNVSVMKAGTDSWTEAQEGMSLGIGDSIKTGDDSSAKITLSEGSTIELKAGTEIELASLDIPTGTGSATVTIGQTIGSIIFRVTRVIDPGSRYEVETPTGVVAVRGSGVEIHVTADGISWGCNLEGEIWAIAQGVELQVPEGRCCIIRPGSPPELAWRLDISSTIGGEVLTPGEGVFAYEEGEVVDLVAEPGEGYHFVNWSGDIGTIASVNAASTTITMDDNYSITANFEEGPAQYYTLTIWRTPGGSTNPTDGEHTYLEGTVVSVAAIPAVGYQFVGWTRDVDTIADVDAASTTVTMNGDCSIQANFVAIGPTQYSLTISSTGNGLVTTPGEGFFTYSAGTVVNLVAISNPDCHFVHWTGNVGTVDHVDYATTTITMNGDYSITANFAC